MVSLGPLSDKRYCTYDCPFCYVHADFDSYAKLSINEIIEWLIVRRNSFDVIYISGDTDSFAPKRTGQALDLLESLVDFEVDLVFTTRYVFSELEYERIGNISANLASKGRILFGSTSIAQQNYQHLEPKPIPSSDKRIEQCLRLKELGCVSVLALRPILPNIPAQEYIGILEATKEKIDLVLGGDWYADGEGLLEKNVYGRVLSEIPHSIEEMDYDTNTLKWKIFESKETKKIIENWCLDNNVPFFMRSRPAIEWVRNQK